MAGTQQGERMRGPFRSALSAFEQAHPGVRVELIEMDDDVYQKMGLLTLFVGGNPPDLYFQWGGYLVRKYAAAGYALDLTEQFPAAERRRYLPSSWASCAGSDGRLYLWPDSASVTTVMWYRKSLFRAAGLKPPTTWEDLLRTCERLKARGTIPIAVGNRELWPGGNFAAYFLAHYAGVDRYNEILGLKPGTRLDDPVFVRALELLAGLQKRGYLNAGVNGVGTDDARSLLAQGKAAMHPIGDWLVSEADEADVQDLDAFLLPRLPGQEKDERALLALSTGYMVNRETPHPGEAIALLKHLTSDAVQRDWVRHGHVSAVRAAAPESGAPAGQLRLLEMLDGARATALAPDVGFNLEVSDAFLDAVSLVLGGRASAGDALAAADAQVRALRATHQARAGR
jgi:raffinose/stachyose/melibiose transport system substrate-binding protein